MCYNRKTVCVCHSASFMPASSKHAVWSVISGFHRDVDDNCALLGYYAPSNDNPLPKFCNKVSAPSSRPLKMGPIRCPKTSVKDYHSTLCNTPGECGSHAVGCYMHSQLKFSRKVKHIPRLATVSVGNNSTMCCYTLQSLGKK
jgi:hypothetical protein